MIKHTQRATSHFNSGHYVFKCNQSNDLRKLDQPMYTVDHSFYYSFSYDSSVYYTNLECSDLEKRLHCYFLWERFCFILSDLKLNPKF